MNLFSIVDRDVKRIYSLSTAAGLVLATGTVGKYRGDKSNADVFLSRSGGYDWVKILDGKFSYNMIHHGSLLAAVPIGPSMGILYSWTQGLDWESCLFMDELIIVTSLIDIIP